MGNTSTQETLTRLWQNCMATFRMNGGQLLWQNPNPSSAFVPDTTVEGNSVKTVTLSQNISNFNYIIIGYKKYKNADQSIIFIKLKLALQNELYLDATNTSQYEKIIVTRSAFTDYTDGTKIHFRAGYRDQTVDNDRAIPVYIYGTNDLGYLGNADLSNYMPLSGTDALTGSIVPSSDKAVNLGSSSKRFYYGYFYRLLGLASLDDQNGHRLTLPGKSGTIATIDDTNISKYKLGAFDTYTENSDGTVTITRQTGYLRINDYIYTATGITNPSSIRYYIFGMPGAISQSGTSNFVFSFGKYQDNWGKSSYPVGTVCLYQENSALQVGGPTASDDAGLRVAIAAYDIRIQYKLATSYTENIIANNRNNAYDNFLTEQYNNTLNLTSIKSGKTVAVPSQTIVILDKIYIGAGKTVSYWLKWTDSRTSTGNGGVGVWQGDDNFNCSGNLSSIWNNGRININESVGEQYIGYSVTMTSDYLYFIAAANGNPPNITIQEAMCNYGNSLAPLTKYDDNSQTLLWVDQTQSGSQEVDKTATIPNMSKYRYIVLGIRPTSSCAMHYVKVKYETNHKIAPYFNLASGTSDDTYAVRRSFTITDSTTIKWGQGYYGSSSGNGYCLLIEVWGTNLL